MIEIDKILKRHDLKTKYYKNYGKAVLINSNIGKLVLKPKIDESIYEYLDSRSFNYYPKKIIKDDIYDIVEYIDEVKMPDEQKILDLINLVSLLHNKTTFYKDVDVDEYKKIYEDLNNNIDYLFRYYNDLMSIIESKVYMSPSELLLARNISIVFFALKYSKNNLDKWYKIVEEKRKRRFVVIHNNLDLDHFIRGKTPYLISWDNSKIDIPIYDFYKLYKKRALDFDFEHLLRRYEHNYPLLEEERILLFVLISIPDKIEFTHSLYENCKLVNNLIDYLYKTEEFISPYNFKNTTHNNQKEHND